MFEFNLPEENEEYKLHCDASDFHGAMWEYAQWLRSVCKHEDPSKYNAEHCREKFYAFLNERNLSL
jgi:hypothetical protein